MLYHVRNPCSDDTDEIFFTNDSIKFVVNGTSYGNGKLFISKKSMTWINDEHVGVKLSYSKIACHALATQKEESSSHVLMTYTSPIFKPITVDDEDDDEEADNDVSALDMTSRSIEFHAMTASSADCAKKMFDSISDGIKINETEDMEAGEENSFHLPTAGDFGGFYTEGTEQLTSKGMEIFNRLDAMLTDPDECEDDDYYDSYEDPQSFGEMAIDGDVTSAMMTTSQAQPGQFDDDE